MSYFSTPDDMLAAAWRELRAALNESGHAFRTPGLATLGSDGWPQVRTIVLREVDSHRGSLQFYSDARTQKIKAIAQNHHLAWLFWDPDQKLQVRARGRGEILTPDRSDDIWAALAKRHRRDYAAELAPGTITSHSQNGLPGDWEERSLAATDYARLTFRAVECLLTELDLLYLDRAGHQRAQFSRQDAAQPWQGSWVIP